MRELFIEAQEDKVDGGYVASALGYGIHTQAETLDELRRNILDAVDCYFDKPDEAPTICNVQCRWCNQNEKAGPVQETGFFIFRISTS